VDRSLKLWASALVFKCGDAKILRHATSVKAWVFRELWLCHADAR